MTRRVSTPFGFASVVALFLLSSPVGAQLGPRLVFVRVVDGVGSPVADLTATDFDITENGASRAVTRVASSTAPMRIVLFLDSSSAVEPHLNSFRAGLNAFLDALPGDHEVGLMTTGGQLHPRVQPTADRQKLKAAAASFAPDGGPNAFLDSLVEADRRFLQPAQGKWPVFVILTTDNGEMYRALNVDSFNRLVTDFVRRAGSAHVIILRGQNAGPTTDLALNLADNTRGMREVINVASGIPDKMKAVAARLAADHNAMAGTYELEYVSNARTPPTLGVRLLRLREGGAALQFSGRRPF